MEFQVSLLDDDYPVQMQVRPGVVDFTTEYCVQVQKTYALTPVTTKEGEARELHFVCELQEDYNLWRIQRRLCDPDITAAAYDGDLIYVRYWQPSHRSGGQWYRVQWRDHRGRFVKS